MATQGPLSPGTVISGLNYGANNPWTNPGNAAASDNAYATVTANSTGTNALEASNFGFTIPTGATVDGILVEIEAHASASGSVGTGTYVLKGGSQSPNQNNGGALTTTDAYYSMGSATDKWSFTWTPADINASTFGVRFEPGGTFATGKTISVDHIRVTVYYTVSGTVTSQTQDVRATGATLTSTTQNIRATGTVASSAARDVRLVAQASSSRTQDVRLAGQDTSSTSSDTRLAGENQASASRDTRLAGEATANQEIDARLTGELAAATSQAVRTTGVVVISSAASRDVRVEGTGATSSAKYDARIEAQQDTQTSRASRITGRDTDSTRLDASVSAQEPISAAYSVRTTGYLPSSQMTLEARIAGQSSQGESVAVRVIGVAADQVSYDVRVTGFVDRLSRRLSRNWDGRNYVQVIEPDSGSPFASNTYSKP